jgi:hypothetical protein
LTTDKQYTVTSCILGRIPVIVAAQLCYPLQRFAPTEVGSFFFNHKKSEGLISCKDIRIYFAPLQDGHLQIVGEKIFSSQRSSLYKTADGTLQLCQLSENRKDILWSLSLDPKFSRFEYSLSPEAGETSDLFQLAFNRFLFQHTFINHHGLIIHAAGGSIRGKGMVFPAISGTGKSTLGHLLLPHSENQLFSEERIIMRQMDDAWQLWGTPWHGTGVIAHNESAPLSALVFLSQAPVTKISELSPSTALRRLREVVSIPWYSPKWTEKGLAICESLLRDIPAFELAFRPDQTAVQAVADLAASLD